LHKYWVSQPALRRFAWGIPALAIDVKGGGLGVILGIIDIVTGITLIASFAGL
jgi:hypothetical protein